MKASAVIAIVLAVASLRAADRKMQLADLPAAVRQAVQQETQGATIKSIAKESENGKTTYEVETLVNGHARDLVFDAKGALLVAEEALGLETVPAPVRAAFEARGKVLKVESVTKGKSVTYEAQVEKNGKKTEVVVNAEGKPVKP